MPAPVFARRRGVAALSSPLQLPGLVLWLDASDPTTLFQDSALTTPAAADADPVGGWKDKSGAGNHVTQATAGFRPTLKIGIQNGRSILRLDGVADMLVGSAALSWSHVFAVAKFSGNVFTSNFPGLFTGTANTAGNLVLSGFSATTHWFDDTALTTTDYWANGANYPRANMLAPMNAWGTMSLSQVGSASITPQVGLDRSNANRYWTGDVAAVLVYNNLLSPYNRTRVLAYLNRDWRTF